MASTTSAILPLSSSSYLVVECKTSRKSAAPSLALPTVHQLSSQSSLNLAFKNVTYCRKIASKVAVVTTGEAAVAEATVAEAAVAEAAVAEAAVAEAAVAEAAVAEAAVAEEAVAEEAVAVAETALAEAVVAEEAVAEEAVAEEAVAVAETTVAEATIAEATVAEPTVAEATVAEATELPEIVKTIQKAWDEVEDKYAVSSLAVAGFVGLWASAGMVSALDQLPIVPGLLEAVGVGYSGWFAYRNLIFKSDRDALIKKIKDTYKDIIGSSN